MKVTRFKAFSIHLTLSLLVFSSLVAIMYFSWFPGEYFTLDGGLQGLKIVGTIDIVLGPALTLLLFKPGKPKLVMDMSVIATLQLSALLFGFYSAYQQQTVGLVFAENEFSTLSYQDLQLANQGIIELGLIPVDFDNLGNGSPKQIFIEQLTSVNYEKYLEEVLNGMPALRERTDKYHPLSEHHKQLAYSKLDYDELIDNNALEKIESLLRSEDKSLNDYEYYKFRARYGQGIALFNTDLKHVVHLISTVKKSL